MKIISISKDNELDLYRKSDFRTVFKVGISKVDTLRTSGDYAYILTSHEEDKESLLKIAAEIIHSIGVFESINEKTIYSAIREELNKAIHSGKHLNVSVSKVSFTETIYTSDYNLEPVHYGPLSVDCDILYVLS